MSHRLRLFCTALLLTALGLLAACSPVRGLLIMEDHASAEWGLALRITPPVITTGSTKTRVHLLLAQPGYLTLMQVGTDGSLDVVFPNAQDAANRFAAGKHILPRAHWQLRAEGPAGHGRLIAITTRESMPPEEVRSAFEMGAWHKLGRDYGFAMARYRETEAKP